MHVINIEAAIRESVVKALVQAGVPRPDAEKRASAAQAEAESVFRASFDPARAALASSGDRGGGSLVRIGAQALAAVEAWAPGNA